MSAGYASRLKEYPNKGVCGLPERFDTARSYQVKRQRLAALFRQHRGRIAILTGAGISTSAGISDFRGPNGIWTLEQKKQQQIKKEPQESDAGGGTENGRRRKRRRNEPRPEPNETTSSTTTTTATTKSMDFSNAQPTLTHNAIRHLVEEQIVSFVVTQNVDGLHQRSGLSRNNLAVLHGCIFTEKCQACGLEHFRDAECGGMSFAKTGRRCDECRQPLRDTLLDWRDPLPLDDWERSQVECERASLILCLGTSLRIEPAASLCEQVGRHNQNGQPRYVIVNLQQTPYDDRAALIIRSRVDQVMQDLMSDLLEDGDSDSDDDDSSEERVVPVDWNKPPPDNQVERLWRSEAATAEYRSKWWDLDYRQEIEEE